MVYQDDLCYWLWLDLPSDFKAGIESWPIHWCRSNCGWWCLRTNHFSGLQSTTMEHHCNPSKASPIGWTWPHWIAVTFGVLKGRFWPSSPCEISPEPHWPPSVLFWWWHPFCLQTTSKKQKNALDSQLLPVSLKVLDWSYCELKVCFKVSWKFHESHGQVPPVRI